jgi:hypothetical protein
MTGKLILEGRIGVMAPDEFDSGEGEMTNKQFKKIFG